MSKRKISAITVLALVAALFAATARADLLANWSFDDASGAGAADATGHGFTAATVAGYSTPTAGTTGAIGNAFTFFKGGANSGIILRAPATSGTYSLVGSVPNLTLSSWFRTSSFTQGGEWALIRAYNSASSTNRIYNFGMNTYPYDTDKATGLTEGTSSQPCPYIPFSSMTANTWHQLTFTYESTSTNQIGTLYLDGVAIGTASTSHHAGNPVTTGAGSLNDATAMTHVYLSSAIWGTTYYGNAWAGDQDDAGVWNETLSAAKAAAMYNTPMMKLLGVGATLGSTGYYGQLDMEKLFKVYDESLPTTDINGMAWNKLSMLPGYAGQTVGSAWYDAASGSYNVLLGAGGSGVSTGVVPEPSTLALLAAGLVGLLTYAWRKRK